MPRYSVKKYKQGPGVDERIAQEINVCFIIMFTFEPLSCSSNYKGKQGGGASEAEGERARFHEE